MQLEKLRVLISPALLSAHIKPPSVIGRINLKFDSNQNHNQLILLYYFESKIKINLPYLIRNQKSKIKIKIRIKNHKNLKVKTSKNFFVFYNLIGKIGIEK